MSNLSIKRLQIGNSTAGNNFVIRQPDAADATLRISNGNIGTTTDLVTINASGSVGIINTAPSTRLHIHEAGALIVSGNAIKDSTMKGITVANTTNGDESVGLWFSTGPNSHWSGISGQRSAAATTWGTDLRFYTHEDATVDLTYARERMRIDSVGRVRTPYQPMFYARGPESNTTLTNGADLNFNNAIQNTGGHYNTSNYRFTAPIAGNYLFTWSFYMNGTPAGRVSLKVNGGAYNNLQMECGYGMSQSAIFKLNANDYVTVGDWQSISGQVVYMGHSHFSGYLLG